jgi:urease accessory protein
MQSCVEVGARAALSPLLKALALNAPSESDASLNAAQWWRVLQIADAAFPAGGFAHSSGLEAALHRGYALHSGLDGFVQAHLWNTGRGLLPFVGAAHDHPSGAWIVDRRLDAQLINHVTNRASRTQGRAFLATCAQVFEAPTILDLAADARGDPTVSAHLAPIFGACLAALGIGRTDTLRLYLYTSLRGVVSAAIRLGLTGPHEGQRVQGRHGPTLDAVIACFGTLAMDHAATTAPIIDIVAATHDRLYARLFQS